MSRIYSAGQYEMNYSPERLGNWQQSDNEKQQRASSGNRFATLQQPTGKPTQFIVDSNGHLLPGVKKVSNSFRTQLTPMDSAPSRWPKPLPTSTIQGVPAAIMGYKGIITTYLPRNHTVVKAVEIKGVNDTNYL